MSTNPGRNGYQRRPTLTRLVRLGLRPPSHAPGFYGGDQSVNQKLSCNLPSPTVSSPIASGPARRNQGLPTAGRP